MSFINWGNETPEQRELRKKLEHREFLERAMARKMFEARGANSAATSASAAASAGAAGGGGSGSSGGLSLTLEFNSVAGAQEYVPNLTSVASWNNFFDLPTYGNPFTRVSVNGATVSLYGGSSIILRTFLFVNVNDSLISVDDQLGCIIELENSVFGNSRGIVQTNLVSVNFPAATVFGNACFTFNSSLVSISLPTLTTIGVGCFDGCYSISSISLPLLETVGSDCFTDCTALTSVNLPALTTASSQCFANCDLLTSITLPALTTADRGLFFSCNTLATVSLPNLTSAGTNLFQNCTSLTSVSLPSCTNLGGTVGNNFIFSQISGNTIQLTVPAALMTNNGGNPDGDIQQLQANNTVNVTQVYPL